MRRCLLTLLLLASVCRPLSAHETDPFAVPVGRQFVDLGDLWNRLMHEALRKSAEEINLEIRRALAERALPSRLTKLRSPEHFAAQFRWQFPTGLLMIEEFESALHSKTETAKHPGKIVAYRSPVEEATYTHNAFFPDPRILGRVLLVRSSTIKVHGVYMGTDKFGHFLGWGHMYFLKYRFNLRLGMSRKEAMLDAVKIGKTNPVGEVFLHGVLPTGVYSNADLAANYVGLKFYLNLTEPVTLKRQRVEPMLKLNKGLWELQPHVRPDGKFFSLFVSDHYNEALNPCWYDWIMRSQVRGYVKKRRKDLLDWYAGDDPRRRTRAYFDQFWKEMTHYYGEDYGNSADYESLVTIGNTCFDDRRGPILSPRVYPLPPPKSSVQPTYQKIVRPKADVPQMKTSVKTSVAVNAAKPPAPLGESKSPKGVKINLRADGPQATALQRSVEYASTVRNDGTQDVKNLMVSLTLSKGLQVTTLDTSAEYAAAKNQFTWRIKLLTAQSEKTLRLKASTVLAGPQQHTLEARFSNALLASDRYATQVTSSLK